MPSPFSSRRRSFDCHLFRLLGRFGSRTRAAGTLAGRFLGGGLAVIVGACDRRRQDGEVQPLATFGLCSFGLARAATTRTRCFSFRLNLRFRCSLGYRRRRGSLDDFGPLGCFGVSGAIPARTVATVAVIATALLLTRLIPAAITFIAAIAIELLRLLLLVGAIILARIIGRIEIVAFIIEVVLGAAEALLLFLLPSAIVGQNAEIMIGKLQIIFRIDPITGHLGVASHILVFFKKLGCIAPRAAINPVAAIATAPIATVGTTVVVIPAAITATGLPVVDQDLVLAFTLPSFTEIIVQSLS